MSLTLKIVFLFIMASLSILTPLAGEVYHHFPKLDSDVKAYVWEETSVEPFDEMMVTWNSSRPVDGDFHISVMVKTDRWSPWLLYMQWGASTQTSFDSTVGELKVYQDGIAVLGGKKATAFRVRIDCRDNAHLKELWALHAFTTLEGSKKKQALEVQDFFFNLDVPPTSQIALPHPRAMSLCSPTSTSAAVSYLRPGKPVEPLKFAAHVHDSGFDIYGNWVFNAAQASHELGEEWQCWVERAENFDVVLRSLQSKVPVVVSIRGPLPGSLHPYHEGHLVVVKGFDSKSGKVLCMDPAYPTDAETLVEYALNDFVEAWKRRGQVVYRFERSANFTTEAQRSQRERQV